MTGSRCQRTVDPVVLCYYAEDPARRPDCTLTATVRFATITLCASCATRRSSVGKGQPAQPLPNGPALDILDWVANAHEQTQNAERILAAAVTRARQNGATWSAIGAQIGVSRQGAQQRFHARTSA